MRKTPTEVPSTTLLVRLARWRVVTAATAGDDEDCLRIWYSCSGRR